MRNGLFEKLPHPCHSIAYLQQDEDDGELPDDYVDSDADVADDAASNDAPDATTASASNGKQRIVRLFLTISCEDLLLI